jgi:mono/diheme cytochrome c family protein
VYFISAVTATRVVALVTLVLAAVVPLVAGCATTDGVHGASVEDSRLREAVAATFEARCGRCHGASAPSAGLSLTGDAFERSLVNNWSYVDDGHRLVKPGVPQESFLLMVLKGEADIRGPHAPPNHLRLSDAETELVARWIASLAGDGRRAQ